MRRASRASFPQHHLMLRESAIVTGQLVPDSDLLRVFSPLTLDTLSTAATLVAGTVVNGWSARRDRQGKPIERMSVKRQRAGASGGGKTR